MDDRPLHILVVEDNSSDLPFLQESLSEIAGQSFELTVVTRLDSALQQLTDHHFDAVLLDLGLPDSRGLDTFLRLRKKSSSIPILIMSGLDDEALAVRAVQEGAQDYLVKRDTNGATLLRSVRYAVERKRSEQRSLNAEIGYRRLFETSQDGIFILDAETGQITDANPFLEVLLGFTVSEFIGKRLWEIGPFRDKAASLAAFRTLQEKGYIRYDDLPLATYDGRFVDVEFISNIYHVGTQKVIQCNIRDNTEKKLALSERDRFFALSLDIMCIVNTHGYFSRLNPAMENVLGFSGAELMARPLIEFVHPEDAVMTLAQMSRLQSGEPIKGFENRYRCLNGSYKWIDWTATFYNGACYFAGHDITARKQDELALEERARLASLGSHVGKALARSGSLQGTLELCAQSLIAHLNASLACVWTLNEQEQTLEMQASAGQDIRPGWLSRPVPIGQRNIGLIASERKPYITNNLANDPRIVDPDWAAHEGMVAYAGYPLVVGDHVVGVMALSSRLEFSSHALKALEAAADEIALYIEHDRTAQALRQAYDDLELRVAQRTVELLQANTELTFQKTILEAQGEASIDGILVVSETGELRYSNRRFAELWCISPEVMAEQAGPVLIESVLDMLQEPTEFLDRIAYLEGHPEEVSHDELLLKDGRVFDRYSAAVKSAGGANYGRIWFFHDITERQQVLASMQEARAEADRANSAKSDFLSRMSHELRTPLNAILGFGQILQNQDLTALQQESVQYILKGGRHLLELINEVLDIARVEAGHVDLSIEPVALADVIPESCLMVRSLSDERNVQLNQNEALLGGIHVLADRQRLKQVLINLLSNSIKYNVPGGRVDIECSRGETGTVRIAVRDTGRGISQEGLKKLFTPFERLDAANSEIEGSGLGLVLSERLTAAMGGTLSVESIEGKGSCFIISLPQVESPLEKLSKSINMGSGLPTRARDYTPEQTPRYCVLCIEDNLSNLRLLEAIFENRPDIELLSAMQGSLGLDLARQHRPDLILLDLHLPDINGEEVLSRIQASVITRDIPIVILSADATPSVVERLLQSGARAYLTKPLNVVNLLSVLDEILEPNRALVAQCATSLNAK